MDKETLPSPTESSGLFSNHPIGHPCRRNDIACERRDREFWDEHQEWIDSHEE